MLSQHDGLLWSNLTLQKRIGIRFRESGGNHNRLTPLRRWNKDSRISHLFRIVQKVWGVAIPPNKTINPLIFEAKGWDRTPNQCKMDLSKNTAFPAAFSFLEMNLSYPLQFI